MPLSGATAPATPTNGGRVGTPTLETEKPEEKEAKVESVKDDVSADVEVPL